MFAQTSGKWFGDLPLAGEEIWGQRRVGEIIKMLD